MPPKQITFTATQLDLIPFDQERNLDKAARFVTWAAEGGAEFVVFPEFLNVGFNCTPDNFKHAESADGPTVCQAMDMAQAHNLFLAFTMAERDGEDIYNAAIIVGPDGFFAKRRKTRPPFAEAFFYKGSHDDHVIPTPMGRAGLAVCADAFRYDTFLNIAGRADFVLIMTSAPVINIFGPHIVSAADFKNVAHLYAEALKIPVIMADRTGQGRLNLPFFPYLSFRSNFTEAACILDVATRRTHSVGPGEGMVTARVSINRPRPEPETMPDLKGFIQKKGVWFSFLYKYLTAWGQKSYLKRLNSHWA